MRKTKINRRLFLSLGLALACLAGWPARDFDASAQAGCSAPGFAPDLPVVTNQQFPQAVAVADFNHDAHADVAVANNIAFSVTVLSGDGAGNFTINGHFAAGQHPYSIAAGDFNLDGHPDVAVVNQVGASNRVSILSGDGTGGLGARREFTVMSSDGHTFNDSRDVAVGDFNLDGNPDLAVAFRVESAIGILLGDGDGGFDATDPPLIPAQQGPLDIVTGEFNGDGLLDLAASHENGYVKIFVGAGDGDFTSNPTLSYDLQTPLNDIATGYFDDDGEIDLVVVDGFEDGQAADTGHATILLGTAGAGFVRAGSFAAHTDSNEVAVGDFNGDAKADLALTNFASNDVSVLLGTGSGSFGGPTHFAVGTSPWGIAAGDFTEDGRPDLVAANRGFNGSSYNVSVLRNTCDVSIIEGRATDGSGAPVAGVTVNLTGTQTRAATTDAAGRYTFAGLPGGNYTVAPSSPARRFSPRLRSYANLDAYRVADFVLLGHAASDFDGDGKTDAAVWNPGSGYWRLVNSSDGTYRQQQWGAASLGDVIVPGDYDGDYKTDFAVWRPGEGNWYVVRSSDNSTLVKGWGAASFGDRPVPGDYDGDRKTDIAVFRPGEGNWYILKSTGGVRLQGWGFASDTLVPADYDGDGKTDVAVWRGGEGNWYIIQSSNGAVALKHWGGASLGDRPVPADYDGDGKADVAVYRPGEATWHILHSSDNSVRVKHWGFDSDSRVPGDFDGDGKADITVWRPAEGNWYGIRSSDNSAMLLNLGLADEVPVMSAYVPQ